MYKNAPELAPTDYLVLGIANCFIKSDGEVLKLRVVEPIPSAALQAIWKQIPTSYELAYGTTLGAVVTADGAVSIPSEWGEVQVCSEFLERAIASARTYKNRPEARELIPVGETCRAFNFSLEKKRVLNAERVVSAEDNVKQHSHTHRVL